MGTELLSSGGDDSGETHTYPQRAQKEVSRLANVLKHDLGVEKGDRVAFAFQ